VAKVWLRLRSRPQTLMRIGDGEERERIRNQLIRFMETTPGVKIATAGEAVFRAEASVLGSAVSTISLRKRLRPPIATEKTLSFQLKGCSVLEMERMFPHNAEPPADGRVL